MVIALEMVFVPSTYEKVALWNTTTSLLEGSGLLEEQYEVGGSKKPQKADKVFGVLAKRSVPFFHVDGKGISFAHGLGKGVVWHYDIQLQDESRLPGRDTLDRWVLAFADIGTLLYARLYDPVWEQWQNERVIHKFEIVGRSTAGLSRTWDPDFEEEVIDTSKNPGRILGRSGYMEALGHEMWLAPEYWNAVGADRAVIEHSFKTRPVGSLLAVLVSDQPFRDGHLPSKQQRRVLFPLAGNR